MNIFGLRWVYGIISPNHPRLGGKPPAILKPRGGRIISLKKAQNKFVFYKNASLSYPNLFRLNLFNLHDIVFHGFYF